MNSFQGRCDLCKCLRELRVKFVEHRQFRFNFICATCECREIYAHRLGQWFSQWRMFYLMIADEPILVDKHQGLMQWPFVPVFTPKKHA